MTAKSTSTTQSRAPKPASAGSSDDPPGARALAKQETRAALIRAAIALFGEQGLDAPSLDAICERAGFTRGAFYVHFKDRDDLMVAVMEEVGAGVLDAVLDHGPAAPTSGAFAATVERFLEAVTSGAYPLTPAGGIRPHQLLDACARSPTIRGRYVELVHESVRRLAGTFAADQARREVTDAAPPEALATIVLALVIGAQTMLELGVDLDLPRAAAATLELLAPTRDPGRDADDPAD
ncbi:MAG: TetR/AcrR family transcriptional regulator [Nannocystaceae bacterium]